MSADTQTGGGAEPEEKTMTDTAVSTTPTVDERLAEQIIALGNLRRFLAAHPELLDIGVYPNDELTRILVPCTTPAELAAGTRILKDGAPLGSIEKRADDDYERVIRSFGAGVTIEVYIARHKVCDRVVVRTELVEVPDPDAPKVTIQREVVEWQCRPILEGATS